MPETSSVHLAQIMDHALRTAEHAQNLMADIAAIAGFYRKRAHDIAVGDEIGYGANEWKLVVDVEQTATPEGDGVVRVLFVDADDTAGDHLFDPLDIVDVKAAPTTEPF